MRPNESTNRIVLSRRKLLGATTVIGASGVAAGWGTSALFSDESSFEGNELVAGSLDMKVSWEEHYFRGQEAALDHASWEDGELVIDDRDAFMEATFHERFPDKIPPREPLDEGSADPCDVLADVPEDIARPVIDLGDLKPGDFGEVTFGFTLCDNPGFVWMTGALREAAENGTSQPESESVAEVSDEVELLDKIEVTVWDDTDCDNVRDEDEQILYDGTLRGALATLGTGRGLELDGEPDAPGMGCYTAAPDRHCIGFRWELPRDVGNEVQTDAVTLDLGFYTEQCRSNEVGTESIAAFEESMLADGIHEEFPDDMTTVFFAADYHGHTVEGPVTVTEFWSDVGPITWVRWAGEDMGGTLRGDEDLYVSPLGETRFLGDVSGWIESAADTIVSGIDSAIGDIDYPEDFEDWSLCWAECIHRRSDIVRNGKSLKEIKDEMKDIVEDNDSVSGAVDDVKDFLKDFEDALDLWELAEFIAALVECAWKCKSPEDASD